MLSYYIASKTTLCRDCRDQRFIEFNSLVLFILGHISKSHYHILHSEENFRQLLNIRVLNYKMFKWLIFILTSSSFHISSSDPSQTLFVLQFYEKRKARVEYLMLLKNLHEYAFNKVFFK